MGTGCQVKQRIVDTFVQLEMKTSSRKVLCLKTVETSAISIERNKSDNLSLAKNSTFLSLHVFPRIFPSIIF